MIEGEREIVTKPVSLPDRPLGFCCSRMASLPHAGSDSAEVSGTSCVAFLSLSSPAFPSVLKNFRGRRNPCLRLCLKEIQQEDPVKEGLSNTGYGPYQFHPSSLLLKLSFIRALSNLSTNTNGLCVCAHTCVRMQLSFYTSRFHVLF